MKELKEEEECLIFTLQHLSLHEKCKPLGNEGTCPCEMRRKGQKEGRGKKVQQINCYYSKDCG